MSCIVAYLQNCTLGISSNGKVNRCLLLYNKNNKDHKRLKSSKMSCQVYWQIVTMFLKEHSTFTCMSTS